MDDKQCLIKCIAFLEELVSQGYDIITTPTGRYGCDEDHEVILYGDDIIEEAEKLLKEIKNDNSKDN